MDVIQIMTRKIIKIGMDDSLRRARDLFEEHGFHHLLVVENQRAIGVISDRDLLRNVSPFIDKIAERSKDLATLNRRVHQIMTRQLVTITSEKSIQEAARVMFEHNVSCLPVVTKHGHPAGIVTSRDLLRALCGLNPG